MVTLTGTLRDLLYSRHSLPYFHCRVVVQFPVGSQDQSFYTTVTPFFSCWSRNLGILKWPGSSFNFQVSGIIASTGGSIPPCGIKMSRLAQHMIMGSESKNFASWSLKVIVSGTTTISFPWFLDPWILAMKNRAPYIGCWFRGYTPFWITLPQHRKVLPPCWCCYWAFKWLFLYHYHAVLVIPAL